MSDTDALPNRCSVRKVYGLDTTRRITPKAPMSESSLPATNHGSDSIASCVTSAQLCSLLSVNLRLRVCTEDLHDGKTSRRKDLQSVLAVSEHLNPRSGFDAFVYALGNALNAVGDRWASSVIECARD